MELKDIYEALSKVENGKEIENSIKSEISKLREESAAHRTAKAEAESKLAELSATVDELKTQDNGSKLKAKTLEEKLADLQEKFEQVENARKEAEQKRIQMDITAKTIKALSDNNAIDPQELAEMLTKNVSVKEDGSYAYKLGDDKVGTIEEGAKAWLETHSWAVRDTQHGGTGGNNRNVGGSGSQAPTTLNQAIAQAMNVNQ